MRFDEAGYHLTACSHLAYSRRADTTLIKEMGLCKNNHIQFKKNLYEFEGLGSNILVKEFATKQRKYHFEYFFTHLKEHRHQCTIDCV